MLTLLGITCVLWTTFELIRLTRSAEVTTISFEEAAAVANRGHARSPRRFAAWDDAGRAIEVEDLGTR